MSSKAKRISIYFSFAFLRIHFTQVLVSVRFLSSIRVFFCGAVTYRDAARAITLL